MNDTGIPTPGDAKPPIFQDHSVSLETDTSPPARSAAHGVVFLSTSSAANVLAGYVIHIVAARMLLPSEYGRFVIVLSIITWVRNLQGSLIIPGLFKVVSEDHRYLRAVLGVAARWYSASCGVLFVLFMALAPLLARAFGDRALTVLLLLAGLDIPLFGIVLVGKTVVTAIRRYMSESMIMSAYAIFRTAGVCALMLVGLGTAGAVLGQSLGSAVAGVMALAILLRLRTRLPAVPCPGLLRRAWFWTGMSLPTTLATATLAALDLWFVKAMMRDPNASGIYGAAYAVSRLPDFVVYAVGWAVVPRVSGALAGGNTSLAASVTREAMRLLMLLLVPTCFLVAGSSSEIASLLFSAKYADAGGPLSILMVAAFFSNAVGLLHALFVAVDRPGLRMLFVLAMLAFSSTLNVLLIPVMGLSGAALAALLGAAVPAVVAAILIYRELHASPPWRTAWRCALAGGVTYVLGMIWHVQGWALLAKLTVLGVLYFLLLFLLRELRKDDLRTLWRTIRRQGAKS